MSTDPKRGRNRLLGRLESGDFQRLAPHLKPEQLKHGQILFEARSEIEFTCFPLNCVLSAIMMMENGDAIEVGTIGNEGAAGLTAFSGAAKSPNRLIVQVPGDGLRVEAATIHEISRDSPGIYDLLLRHNQAFLAQVSQSVACNGLHPILQRCCRWLLMTHDRVEHDEVPLTHEFLSYMLGVRRQGVTETLGILQQKELIRSERGTIIITDRRGMEAECCECYRSVRDEYERLLGPD